MNKRYIARFLLLLPALLLSLACNLGVVRKWVKVPAVPTSAPATPTAVPIPSEATLAPAPLTGTPLPPGEVYVGEVELDMDALEQLQETVDQGHQPWRLDPLEAARDEGRNLGFDPVQDTFELLPSPDPATGEAQVLVLHGESFYVVHLLQPVRVGSDGIWAIVRVDKGL
ncbi:MAG: hypothetical protein U9R15_19060 [Chloroflexota bacterium]|nr:hypothetical protein [Chloroflexota bacterium]